MTKELFMNFTGIGSTMFKIYKSNFEGISKNHNVRSIIDPLCDEFDYPEDISRPIDKAWYKQLVLLSIFDEDNGLNDFINRVNSSITSNIKRYPNYEINAKLSIASLILLLRTGEYDIPCYVNTSQYHLDLVNNMSIGDIIVLLKEELELRVRALKYIKIKSGIGFIEIEDLHYNYNEICSKYSGDEYIKYITTAEHTKDLISHQRMIAQNEW